MSHLVVGLLFISLTNGVYFGDASHQVKSPALASWYCQRLVPTFITSAVTPCTYPCLFLSRHKHPHIVVYPEPNGTPCRITTGRDHRFKIGKCAGSVCRPAAPDAPLKRKKRFICLYSLIKLRKAKRRLKELREEMVRLQKDAARSSSAALNSLSDRAAGFAGLRRSGFADGGLSDTGNSGSPFNGNALGGIGRNFNPAIGASTHNTEEIPVIGDYGMSGGAGSGRFFDRIRARIRELRLLGVSLAGIRAIVPRSFGNNFLERLGLSASRGSNGARGGPSDATFPGISNTAVGNTGGRVLAGSGIGGATPGGYNIESTGRAGRGATSERPGRTAILVVLHRGGSPAVANNDGSNLGGSRIGGTFSAPSGLDISSSSDVTRSTDRGSASGYSGSERSVNVALPSTNGHTTLGNNGRAGRNLSGNLHSLGLTGGGMTGAGRTSNTEVLPTDLGTDGRNLASIDLNTPNHGNIMNSNGDGTIVSSPGTGSSVTLSFPASRGEASSGTSSGSVYMNSDRPFPRPLIASVGTLTAGSDGSGANSNTATAASTTSVNEIGDVSVPANRLFAVDNVGN